ncbi:MAG: FlgD immunoglobulin-like domain containing protein, partial [bacterium]
QLIAKGYFWAVGESTMNEIAAWNGSTWSALGEGLSDSYGHGIAVYDGDLVADRWIWNGGSWDSLSANAPEAQAMAVYDGMLIVGGYMSTAGDVVAHNIAAWNGSSWRALAVGTSVTNGTDKIDAMIVFEGQLLAGRVNTAGNLIVSGLASWNGSSWTDFADDHPSHQAPLGVYEGQVVTNSYGEPTWYDTTAVVTWNGTTWEQLGTPLGGNPSCYSTYLEAFANYGDDLIVAGGFQTANGAPVNGIARWDGSSWSALGSGFGGDCPDVKALVVYDDKLIAGGRFETAGGVAASNIASWNGTSWSPLGSGIGGEYVNVRALAVYDHKLIAAGTFETAGGLTANNIASWDGSSWSTLGTGTSGDDPDILALATYNNRLIAAGEFSHIDGAEVNFIAAWNGSGWSSLGSGIRGDHTEVWALAVYDGKLFVGGDFVIAGGKSSAGIACWDEGVEVVCSMTLEADTICFATDTTATEAPAPKWLQIDSDCSAGELNWTLDTQSLPAWLSASKNSGSNPDSVLLSIVQLGSEVGGGTYQTDLIFLDASSSDTLTSLQVQLIVEAGVQVGTVDAMAGESFAVPIMLHNDQPLAGFTLPLKYYTTQSEYVYVDSFVPNPSIFDGSLLPEKPGIQSGTSLAGMRIPLDSLTVIVDRDSQAIIVSLRPIQPPPIPDSLGIWTLGWAYFTATEQAADEDVLIDTATIVYNEIEYRYEFVLAEGEIVVPDFEPGLISIASLGIGFYDSDLTTLPDGFALGQNYPNPFNASTTVRFALPRSAEVTFEVFNILGQVVARQDLGLLAAGEYQIEWDGADHSGVELPSGLYLYRLQAGNISQTRKMLLLK